MTIEANEVAGEAANDASGPGGLAAADFDLLAVFAALPEPTAVFAADAPRFTLLAASDALAAAAQRPREALVGRPLAEAFPDQDAAPGADPSEASGVTSLRASLEAAVRTRAPQRMARRRYDLRRPDGSREERYWDAVNTPVLAPDGAVRYVLHHTEDVTARVRGEATLREREAVAAEQLAQLEAIYRDAPVGLAVFDRELRYLRINDRLAEMNGIPATAHIGRTVREVLPQLADEVEAFARRVLETGEPVRDIPLSGETAAQPGVPRRWVEQWYPLRDASGAVIGINVVVEEVTERFRAEAALRESEARYRALVTASSDVVYRMSPDWSEMRQLDGQGFIADTAVPSDNWLERYIHPDDQPRVVEAIRRAVRTKTMFELEHRVRRVDGSLGWTLSRAVPLLDAAGEIVEWFGTASDVTARRQAEGERERLLAALEVERSRLATVFAQSPSILALVRGPEHVFELANEAYLRLIGRRDVIGRPLLEAVSELRGQGFEVLLDGVLATGEPYVGREVSTWVARAPGAPPEERFFDFVYLPHVEPHVEADGTRGTRVTGVIAHGTDVTEQVRARREVERARDRAARLQALTAALAATTTPEEVADVVVAQGVAATGAATGLLALRERPPSADGPGEGVLLRHHGVSALVLDRYSRFPLTAPGPVAECLRSGVVTFVERGEALRARFPEIPEIWDSMGTEAVATVPLAVAGDVVGAMSFSWTAPRELPEADREFFLALGRQAAQALERARLLAAERAARAQAEQARTEAEAANRAKGEFLAVMSHELRTPLNAIAGYAELMEMGLHGPVTEQQRADLGRIQQSQRHLLGLINQVLNYTRIETGAVRYDLADVPVAEAIAAAEALVIPQARAKGLTCVLGGCPPYLAVRADREKLQQVLLNLLSNAIKFTEPGGEVRVSCTVREVAVAVAVADTGVGVAPEKLSTIFEPFVQVDQRLTRPHEGVGLGLAISRDLARGMGGDLTAESAPGAGSTFTLTLPAA